MKKYIAQVDHRAGYKKAFTYIELESTQEACAALEAFQRGYERESVFCVNLLLAAKYDKRLEAYDLKKVAQIAADGGYRDGHLKMWGSVSKYELEK